MDLRAALSGMLSDRRRLAYSLAALAFAYLVLRACVSGAASSLPGDLENEIQDRYVQCITPEDTAIWPGEPRQPECGRVDIEVLGDGTVPPDAQASGITAALCYSVTYENPYWSTLGTTRHEVKWATRTSLKVAVQDDGEWRLFPDQELHDLERWQAYACPRVPP